MAEIDDKKLKELEIILNRIIHHGLYEPGGDPCWTELASASDAYKAIQIFGLKVDGEKDVRAILSKDGNICNEDFLKTFDIV